MDTTKSGTLDTVRQKGFRVTITMMVVLTSAYGGSTPSEKTRDRLS